MVGLDIQDEMGRHEVGHIDNSMKVPLNNGAGCRFEGQFSINKVRRSCMGPFSLLPAPRSPSSLKLDGRAVCPLGLPADRGPAGGSGRGLLFSPAGEAVGGESLRVCCPEFECQLYQLLARQRPTSHWTLLASVFTSLG